MNNEDGRQEFEVRISLDGLRKDADKAKEVFHGLSKSVDKDGEAIDEAMRKAALAVGTVFSVTQLAAFTRQLISVRGEFEKLEVAFKTMLGDAGKAETLMNQITEFAATTPFDLQGVANGAKQLLAYGSAAEDVTKELTMLGNIASGLSIPLNDIIYLYGTTRTQGRMYTMDLRQFMGRGIPLAEELAKQFGVTKDQVAELVTQGRVGFNEMSKALESMTSEGGKFYNLMDEQSKTLAGRMSNLGDSIQQMINDIGKSTSGILNKGIDVASSLVENYQKVGRVLAYLVTMYGAYKAAVIAVAAARKIKDLAGMVSLYASLAKEIHNAKDAMTALSMATNANPYGLVASAIGAVVMTVISLTRRSKEAATATGEMTKELEKERQKIDELFRAAKDENKSREERKKAITEINDTYGKYLDYMLTEKTSVYELKGAYDKLTDSVTESYLARAKEQMTGDAEKRFTDRQGAILNMVQRRAKNGGVSAADMGRLMGEVQDILRNGQGSNYGALNAFNQINDLMAKYGSSKGLASGRYLDIEQFFGSKADYEQAQKDYKDWADGYKATLKDAVDFTETETKKTSRSISQVADDIRKAQKDIANLRASIQRNGATEDDTKKLQELADTLDGYEKEYKLLTGNGLDGKGGKSEAEREAEDALRDYTEARKDAEKEVADLQYENRRANEKGELERIEIERQHALEAIDAEEKALKEKAEKAGETNPDLSVFDMARGATNASYDSQRKKVLDSYVRDFEDANAKSEAISEEYGYKIAALRNALSKATTEREKELYTAAINEAEKREKAAIAEITGDAEKKYKDLFGDVARMSRETLKKRTAEAEKALKKETDPQVIKDLKEQLDQYYEELENWQNVDMAASWQEVGKEISKLIKQTKIYNSYVAQGNDKAEAQGDAIARTKDVVRTMAIGAGINSFVSGLQKAAGYMAEIAEASGDISLNEASEVIGSFAQNLGAAAEGAAQGGWIGAIVGGVQDIIGQTAEAFTHAKTIAAQYEQFVTDFHNKLELLKYDINDDDFDTIFGTNSLEKATDAFKKYREAFDAYDEYINAEMEKPDKHQYDKSRNNWGLSIFTGTGLGISRGQKSNYWTETRKAYEEGMNQLQGMMVNTTHKSGWAKFWGAADKYKSLFDIAPEIWDNSINGEFDIDAAKAFLETNKDISDTQRKQIQNAIDLAEAYQNALKEVQDVVDDFTGSLSESIVDNVWDKFVKDGEISFDDIQDIGSDAIKKLGKQMMAEMLNEAWMKKYKDSLVEAFGSGNYTDAIDIIDQMMREAPDVLEGYSDILQHFIDKADEMGYDLTGDEDSRSASSKGIAAASQDSIDELNGRMTAVQGHTFSISENTRLLVDNTNAILRSVTSIDQSAYSIDGRMEGIESDMRELRSAVGDLTTKGIRIRG